MVVKMNCYAEDTKTKSGRVVVGQCRPGDIIQVSDEAGEYLISRGLAQRATLEDRVRAGLYHAR